MLTVPEWVDWARIDFPHHSRTRFHAISFPEVQHNSLCAWSDSRSTPVSGAVGRYLALGIESVIPELSLGRRASSISLTGAHG